MVWTVKCKCSLLPRRFVSPTLTSHFAVNGIVLGEGVARTKGEAKEEASRQTLETLLARA